MERKKKKDPATQILRDAVPGLLKDHLCEELKLPKSMQCSPEAQDKIAEAVMVIMKRLMINMQELIATSKAQSYNLDTIHQALKLTLPSQLCDPTYGPEGAKIKNAAGVPDTLAWYLETFLKVRANILNGMCKPLKLNQLALLQGYTEHIAKKDEILFNKKVPR